MLIKFIFAFIFGTAAGSFANCAIWRLPREESLIWPVSHCPVCGHKLGPVDLVPILSFLWLGGKCRFCHQKISSRYLIVEILLGLLFVLIVCFFQSPLLVLLNFVVATFLVILAFIDLEHQILPDGLNYLTICFCLVYQYFLNPGQIVTAVFSGLGAFISMFLIGLISGFIWKQETLGGGDIKLALAFGFYFSWPKILVALFLSFLVGAVIGLYLIIFKKKSRKDYLAFGPAMVTAAFLTLFLGDFLIHLYLKTLL